MKSFSELTSASQVNNGDLLAISQTSGSGYASKKITVKDITDKSNLNLAEEYDSTSSYAVGNYCIYESVLYKCIASTTGTFDSTKWTSVVVTDEMGSGGGGTGGHTIIDENGNLMTARSGLQFFGAVEVEDDAINNRTLVEVLGGDFYNPVIYSTEEREIGVWTDGKPLYQKSYIGLNVEITNANTWYDTGLSASGVDIFVGGEMIDINNQSYPVNVAFMSSNTKIGISCGMANRTGVILTIRYTKTSDVAGSGTWTPQGVPAEHYSTDEQIIGTYFGDTLYQKTIVLTSDVAIADSWTTIYTNALIGNIAQLVDVKYNNVSNKGVYGVLNFKPNGNNLQAVYPISGGLNVLAGARFTLKYTKSS